MGSRWPNQRKVNERTDICTQSDDRVLLHEFEVEDATQKFSAGLRRHMKRERKIFDECHAMVGTPKS
jgi:hypothetical protein